MEGFAVLLCTGNVVVRSLQQTHDNAIYVFAHVARFGKHGGVGDSEGHVQKAGHGLGQESLARSGRTHQKQVGLFHLHGIAVRVGLLVTQAFVMVIDRHRKGYLRLFLTDNEIVQVGLDFRRVRKGFLACNLCRLLFLQGTGLVLFDNPVAHGNAVAANMHACAGNHLVHLLGGLSAKATRYRRAVFPIPVHES